jgi:hypothetical protein
MEARLGKIHWCQDVFRMDGIRSWIRVRIHKV